MGGQVGLWAGLCSSVSAVVPPPHTSCFKGTRHHLSAGHDGRKHLILRAPATTRQEGTPMKQESLSTLTHSISQAGNDHRGQPKPKKNLAAEEGKRTHPARSRKVQKSLGSRVQTHVHKTNPCLLDAPYLHLFPPGLSP
jgi:hypothetical protein